MADVTQIRAVPDGCEITPNAGRFPGRGPWLDSVDWSVCDWTYRKHEPKAGEC